MTNKIVYTKIFLQQIDESTNDATVDDYIHRWWQNTRSKDQGGLRLTDEGFDLLKKIDVSVYEISFPPDMPFTTKTIIFLDKFIECPYYITKSSIFVTDQKKSIELTLFSGDIRKYGIAKALSKTRNNL